jgi:Arylsulfotransferase (ASST)
MPRNVRALARTRAPETWGFHMDFKMTTPDLSKTIFYVTSICSGIALAFALGLYSGATRNALFDVAKSLKYSVLLVLDEAPTLTKVNPTHFLQPARHDGSGVTVNNLAEDNGDLILLSGFFEESNELRLIRHNGDPVARWPVRFSEIFPAPSHMSAPPATDWNIDLHGALALPDGSVVFNFEFGGLVKLDRCGDIVWTLPRETHHSVERDEGGGFWVPGRRQISSEQSSPFPPFESPFAEDTVLKVSEDGAVLKEISVPKLFYANGLEALLTATGHSFTKGMEWDHEILHLNKVDVLTSDIADDFLVFKNGDLALSIYHLNIVLIVDPEKEGVKWWQVGPWLRQHDAEFVSGGKLVVFNNNTYTSALDQQAALSRMSNILEMDPVTRKHKILFGEKSDQDLLSVHRAKVDVTRSGGLIITEFEGGRAIETDNQGNVIWEYLNRYDSDEVAEITEARVYPATYFNVSDWSCLKTDS